MIEAGWIVPKREATSTFVVQQGYHHLPFLNARG
jgi:hypothetical protein